MASILTKLFTQLTQKTTISDSDIIQVGDTSGNLFKVAWSSVKTLLLGNTDISSISTTITGAILKINQTIGNTNISSIGSTITGAISSLNSNAVKRNDTHAYKVGMTSRGNYTYPCIFVDSKQFDLVPNNVSQTGNVKIVDMKVNYSSSPWKLTLSVYIDGKIYTKTVNFDS